MPNDEETRNKKIRQSHIILRKGPTPGTAEWTDMALHGRSESTMRDAGNVNTNAMLQKHKIEDSSSEE